MVKGDGQVVSDKFKILDHFMKIYVKKGIIKSDVFMTQFKKNRFPKLSDTESKSNGGLFNQVWNSKFKKNEKWQSPGPGGLHRNFSKFFSGQI